MRLTLVALTLLAACGDEPDEPPAREMAGPGYIPPGAPLKPPPAPPPRKGALPIEFDTLRAFDYDPEADIVPEDVRRLDGRLVELRGVMYYAVEDPERVTDFFLMPDHMVCCFGTPRLNDAVEVVQKKGGVTQYVVNYYLVRGTLHVGKVTNEEGTVLCIYRITDADVEVLE